MDAVADAVIEVAFLGGLVRGLPFLALAVGASALLLPTAGALGLPIALYAFTISAMGWRAAARVRGDVAGWLGLVGAVLFLASDSLLAIHRFVSPLPASDLLVMGTYWGAQTAIAASARSGIRPAGGPG